MNKRKTIDKKWISRIHEVFYTYTDLTSKEKAQILNKEFGVNFDESAYRKKANTYNEGLNAGMDETATDSKLERIAKAELKVKQERKINEIQRFTLNKQLNDSVAFKEISKILKERLSNIKPQSLNNSRVQTPYSELFLMGDEQHRGYEEEIKQLQKSFIKIHNSATSKHITLLLLGDMVEGMHRASTLLSIKKTTTSQVIDYMSILIEGITGLYEKGYTVDVKMVTSNHTNLRPQGKNEFPGNDMAYIIGWTMEQLTKNLKGVTIEVKDIFEFEVDGKKIVILHGHQKFASNKKSLENAIVKLFGYLPDFIIMGHYHQFKVTKEGRYTLIVTPAVKVSTEEYERNAGYVHEPAILRLRLFKDSQDFETRIIHFGKKMEIQGR